MSLMGDNSESWSPTIRRHHDKGLAGIPPAGHVIQGIGKLEAFEEQGSDS